MANVLQRKTCKLENNISIYIIQHVTKILNFYVHSLEYAFRGYWNVFRICITETPEPWFYTEAVIEWTLVDLFLGQFNSRREIKREACAHTPFDAICMCKMHTVIDFHLNKIPTIRCLTYHAYPPL